MKWTEIVLAILLALAVLMWAHERDNRHGIIVSHVIGIAALCNDGKYSTSKRDRGTCSGHGGVKLWIDGIDK